MATTTSRRSRSTKTDLSEADISAMYEGAKDSMSDPGKETEPRQFEPIDSPIKDLGDGKVLLTNIYHPDEEFYISDQSGNWSGKKVSFMDGRLITTPDVATLVKQAAPYVYQEDPDGQWLTHSASGFSTTNAEAWQTFVERYNTNR